MKVPDLSSGNTLNAGRWQLIASNGRGINGAEILLLSRRNLSLQLFLVLMLSLGTPGVAQDQAPEEGNEEPQIVNIDDLRPSADQLMREAVELQQSGNPGRAAAVFTDLLRYHPDSDLKDEVVFRLAECFRSLGRFPESREMLDLLFSEFPKSEWALPARLLAGELAASEDDWAGAMDFFKTAAKGGKNEIQLRALHLWAVSAFRLDQPKEARKPLEELVSVKQENPYLDFAYVKLASLLTAGSPPTKTLEQAESYLQKALSLTQNPDLRAEAAVRAGNLVYSREKYRDAIAYYEMVRKLDAPEQWRELSHLGLVQANFAREDYAEVIRLFNEVKPAFPENLRASIFFMVAESYRLTGQLDTALNSYQMILDDFPDSELAKAALWAKVMVLQQQGDERVQDAAAAFLAKYAEAPEALRARLIRADGFYRKQDFSTAGPMYEDLLERDHELKSLSEAIYRQTLLRAGICAFASERFDAAVYALTEFLNQNNAPEEQARGFWLLGQAYLAQENLQAAEAPLVQLVETYPDFHDREDLLWKLAYLYGNLEMFSDMKKMLGMLLEEFPNDGRKGELYQWLAVSSQRIGENEDAFQFWDKARLVNADAYFLPATRFRISHALGQENREILAEEVSRYERWRDDHPREEPLSPEIYEWLAQEFEKAEDYERAEMNYRKVLAADPGEAQARRTQLKLARLMSKLDRHGAAIREWNQYRDLVPENAGSNDVLIPLAEAYLGAAEFDQAEKLAEQILRQNPEGAGNARGRLLMGELELERGNALEAAKLFRAVAVIAMDDTYTPQALELAETAFRRAGREKEADDMLLRLNKEFPEYESEH